MITRFFDRFLYYISFIFHPIINSGIAFFVLIFFTENNSIQINFLYFIICLLFSVIFPILYIFYLKNKGYLNTIDIKDRNKRLNPLIISVISYYIGFLVLCILNTPIEVQCLMFCYGTNTLLIFIITKWWKVSIHTTGIAGPLVALNFKFGTIIYPFYVLVLIVGISRIYLKRHTLMQVIVGGLIGLLLTYVQYKLFFSGV